MAAFSITVVLWVIPSFLALILGSDSSFSRSYANFVPEGAAAMIGAILLFVLPIDWKKKFFTISWKHAVNINWGTLLLLGGGLNLGNLMFQTKLADAIGQGLITFSGANSVWSVTLVSIFIAIFLSETTSNTAAANVVIPVIMHCVLLPRLTRCPQPSVPFSELAGGLCCPYPPTQCDYEWFGHGSHHQDVRAEIVFDIARGLLPMPSLRILLPLVGLG